MTFFLALQSTYDAVEVSLNQENTLLGRQIIPKVHSSKLLIPSLDQLLADHSLSLGDLTFIAANRGPAPFTTLRVVITTVNGINYGSGIPLVGISGLHALLAEYDQITPVIALLKAFNNEVYFAIRDNQLIEVGCKNIEQFLADLNQRYQEMPLCFVGNGAVLYEANIRAHCAQRALFPAPMFLTTTLERIASQGLIAWRQQVGVENQLQPFYIKNDAI